MGKYGESGFTMLEVLVALVIISVGLLGLAGMQAVAVNNTNTSRMRGIAAIQAESLAAAMHANPSYWQNITGTVTQGTVPTAGSCGSTTCTASQMAGYDVSQWQSNLSSNQMALPSASGTFSCTASTASSPAVCTVNISWQEKVMTLNKTTLSASAAYASASYQMVVQP